MDAQLFMECEEEELEPWQQVDHLVDHLVDEVDEDAKEPATADVPSATPPRAGQLPQSRAPPLHPTQTGGAARLSSVQTFPAVASGPSPLHPPWSDGRRPLFGDPSAAPAPVESWPKGGALQGAPPVQKRPGPDVRLRPVPDRVPGSGAPPGKVVLSVDEFYYGTAGEERAARRKYHAASKSAAFSCDICRRPVGDNLRLAQHTLQHSPLLRGGEERQMCAFCFRHFSGAAQLQGHLRRVHGAAPSSCTCRICEWAFDSESAFLAHMKSNHKPGEMPYVCQVCSYRSSFYSDVLRHFASRHKDSRYLLCVFCLKVSRNASGYQKHVLRHKAGGGFHCNRCRLQFAFPADKKRHKLERHRSVRRPAKLEGLPLGSKVTVRMYGKRRGTAAAPPGMGATGMGDAPLLRDPSCLVRAIKIKAERREPSLAADGFPPAKAWRSAWLNPGSLSCLECGGDVSDFAAHYPTHARCLLCAFASCCSRAYAAHMIRHHVPRHRDAGFRRRPPPCPFSLACSDCGFASASGDEMAAHLALRPRHAAAVCHSGEYVEPDIPPCLEAEGDDRVKEEEEEEEEEEPYPDTWKPARDDEGDEATAAAPFAGPGGPRAPQLRDGDAADFFDLLFPPPLVELIAAETNAHAEARRRRGAGLADWLPLGPRELRAFLGQCVLGGAHPLPDRPAVAPRRFRQLAAAVRMGRLDGGRGREPLRPFRRMLDILSAAMWEAYRPNCCLSVDRAPLPAPEGAGSPAPAGRPQVWLLCDSKSGYCHRFYVEVETAGGREAGSREAGSRVARELLRGLEHKRHQIFLAGSLTSAPLLRHLLERGIYASGSFPAGSRVLPPALWRDGRLDGPGDFLQRRRGPLLATRWRDAKEMGCLSTNAPAGRPDTVWRRSRGGAGAGAGLEPVRRPLAFRLLQENMRGVDICKQLLACNPLGGIPRDRHWRGLFWFLVNLSVVNAFIVLRESRKDNPPSWVRDGLFAQAHFRRRLGLQLTRAIQCGEVRPGEVRPGAVGPRGKLPGRHRLRKIGGSSKKCRQCGGERGGPWGCALCRVRLCKEPRCFWEYHGKAAPHQATDAERVRHLPSERAETADIEHSDHLAPLEHLSEEEEEAAVKEEEQLWPATPQLPDHFPSAHQLRVALLFLCAGARQAAAVFGTEARLVRAWLRRLCRGPLPTEREGDPEGDPDGEAQLAAWLLSRRERQLPLDESVFFHRAAALHGDGFRASYRWGVLFMLRHGLGPGREPAPPASLAADVHAFRDFVRRTLRVHGLPRGAVAAADELCLFLDPLAFRDPRRRAGALSFVGAGAPLLTVCLAALADGTALPALVLLSEEGSGGGGQAASPPSDVALVAALRRPPPGEAFKLWTRRVWLPYVGGGGRGGKSLLLLDRHHEHAGEPSLAALSGAGTLPAVLPEGSSFLLQPLQLAAKPALERFLGARWDRHCRQLGDDGPQDWEGVAPTLIRWTVRALARLKDLRRLWRTSFQMTGILAAGKDHDGGGGAAREEDRRALREELEETLLSAEDLPNEREDSGDEDGEGAGASERRPKDTEPPAQTKVVEEANVDQNIEEEEEEEEARADARGREVAGPECRDGAGEETPADGVGDPFCSPTTN
ncbi:pogo transposable element with ZNF domain isoform X2 [Stigmatopora nigra]